MSIGLRLRALASTAAAGTLLLGLFAGCSSGDAAPPIGPTGKCLMVEPPVKIHLHNSGISCAGAEVIVYLMAGGESKGPEVIRGQGGKWTCGGRSDKEGIVFRKCRQGGLFFTVQRTGG